MSFFTGKKDVVSLLQNADWDQLRKAAAMNVCEINIDSDGRLVVTALIRKVLAEQKGVFDPRKYLGPAREELKNMN